MSDKVVHISKGHKDSNVWRRAQVKFDSWLNVLTGIGVRGTDKVITGDFAVTIRLVDQFLESLYNGDDMAARIVDAVPEEALREGYEILIEPDEQTDESTAVAKEMGADIERFLEDELHATERLVDAWVWGRLFGGGLLYPIINDGNTDQAEPLNEGNIRSIDALTVIDKRDVIPHRYYRDKAHPKFGEVESYRIHKSGPVGVGGPVQILGLEIHETRLIIFGGARSTIRERQVGEGWDFSVLQRVFDVLRQFNLSWAALSNMLQMASQGVFAVEGLIDMIAGGQKDVLQTRMALVDAQRSVARSLLIDAEKETFTNVSQNFAGVPEAMRSVMLRIAAAAKMPLTVLMGMSPAGMNATGESDRLIWAQAVAAEQSRVLRPRHMRLIELAMLAKEGPTGGRVPERWKIKYPALIQMTDEQLATIRKTTAETDQIYLNTGVLFPEEIAISRFTMGGFSTETSIDTSDRAAMLEGDPEPEPPPEPPPGEPADPPDPAEPPQDPDAVDPRTALAGGQITALQAIVVAVSAGDLPKTTAVRLMAAAFPFSEEEAARILEDIEEPDDEPPTPMPPGAAPPFPPGGPPEPNAEPEGELEPEAVPGEGEPEPDDGGSSHLDQPRGDASHPVGDLDANGCRPGETAEECAARKRRERADQAAPAVVQTLIFSKERFDSVAEARGWISDQDTEFRTDKVDETETSFRFRQREPGNFTEDSLRTISLTRGVSAVVGRLRERRDQGPAIHTHPIPPELQEQLGGAFTLPAGGTLHRHVLPNGGMAGDARAGAGHTHTLPFRGVTGRPVDAPDDSPS